MTLILHEAGRRKRRWTLLAFIGVVVVPTVVASIYYGLIATPKYVSEAQVVIQGTAAQNPINFMLAGILGPGAAGSGTDQRSILHEYLTSGDMMQRVEGAIDLKRKWGDESIDFFSRLPADVSDTDFLEYYRDQISVLPDSTGTVITIKASAFNGTDAQQILDALLMFAEDKLNRMHDQERHDSLEFARRELAAAEKRLADARASLEAFRRQHGELDPIKIAEGRGQIVQSLYAELVSARSEHDSLLAYMKKDSPQVRKIEQKIGALQRQIADEQALLAGPTGNYPEQVARYQDLRLEEEFSQTSYTSALAFLESARTDAQRKHSYVIDFVGPSAPDEPTEPRRLRIIISVFLAGLVSYFIGSLVVSAIKDHAKL